MFRHIIRDFFHGLYEANLDSAKMNNLAYRFGMHR